MTSPVEFDPHWEWVDVTTITDREPVYVKGRCRHLDVVPVHTLVGETVAQLCLTCDAQLPPSASS